MDNIVAQLESDYCPPLDSALLQAILLDFDLSNEDELGHARGILDSLQVSAAEEEATFTFNATGVAEAGRISPSIEGQSDSADTELSSLSNGLSKSGIYDKDHGEPCSIATSNLNSLDSETKATLLQELFPAITHFTITHTLRKCDNDWQRALDELLNISFFTNETDSDGGKFSNKGIDAFVNGEVPKRDRRKRRQGLGLDVSSEERKAQSVSSRDSTVSPSVNKWQTAASDVEFIARHTRLSPTLVRSTYYANSASVAKTISQLLHDLMNSTAKFALTNAAVESGAIELGYDFPTISSAYLTALIQLTHPSTASAHELAKALTSKPISHTPDRIVPTYTPLILSEDTGCISPSQVNFQPPVLDHSAASSMASSHREAHRILSAQAQAAYKRSRSQHLMGGAAAYYSSVSRDHATSAATYSSAAADALVASQSSKNEIDLHGVVVSDAIRIANRETQTWWNRLGESKVNGRVGAETRQQGFKIVVGVGRHSEGGKSRIGPAVYSALINKGWKVEKGDGALTVTGRAKIKT